MPRRLVFKNHPETGSGDVRTDRLFERPIIAIDVLYEDMLKWNLDYFVEYAQEPSEDKKLRREAWIGGKQPLVYWMSRCMDEVEKLVREKFSWTLERHCVLRWCSEESENAFVCSPPVWIVTIHDFEGSQVLKYLSVRFDEEYGTFIVFRGVLTSNLEDWLEKTDFTRRSKNINRLVDAINEFQRIRNFRLRRMGITIPE